MDAIEQAAENLAGVLAKSTGADPKVLKNVLVQLAPHMGAVTSTVAPPQEDVPHAAIHHAISNLLGGWQASEEGEASGEGESTAEGGSNTQGSNG